MKKIILATLAAAALVACAKEDVVVASKGEAIAFNNAFVDNTTKAIDPSTTTDNLMGFQVYGTTEGDHDDAKIVNIFNNVSVANAKYTGEYTVGTSWKYAATYTQYWVDGNTYNFAAVANAADGAVEVDGYGMPSTITYDATNQQDLLYAVTPFGKYTKDVSDKEVSFTFNHLLSKAVFSFTNTTDKTTDTGYFYTVKDIKISGIGQTADYDVASTTWGVPATSYTVDAPLVFGNIVETIAASVAGTDATHVDEEESWLSNYERLLIPGTYDVTITCTISLYLNEEKDSQLVDKIDYETTLTDFTFQKGYAYKFNLAAGLEDVITFTVTKVEDWNKTHAGYDPGQDL